MTSLLISAVSVPAIYSYKTNFTEGDLQGLGYIVVVHFLDEIIIFQALLPVIFTIVPMIIFTTMLYGNLRFGPQASLSAALLNWQTCFNPILTLWFVKPFRKKIASRFANSSTETVADIHTTYHKMPSAFAIVLICNNLICFFLGIFFNTIIVYLCFTVRNAEIKASRWGIVMAASFELAESIVLTALHVGLGEVNGTPSVVLLGIAADLPLLVAQSIYVTFLTLLVLRLVSLPLSFLYRYAIICG
ncbi:unnamed protein product [Toxocara canis]|uniref:Uncharacterized protein n=1 Tax=Toxocara canis TaxID=6265 RepID=A0A3P7IPE0_TOXCA|nr:unnamed protein product [Toxocara canis]